MQYYKKSHDMKNPYGVYQYAKGLEKGLANNEVASKEDLTSALKLYTLSADANVSPC